VSLSTEWIATLDGYVNAQIRPQVPGYLIRRDYEEGTIVRKDQVMFEIDPRPFEAVLAQAQARVGEAQAQLGRTERDLERDRPLAVQRAIAQSQLDNDIQANLAAEAAIKSATAAVDTARLNLGFTKVTSLVTGVAAIATAQIGDLVGPTTLLTTVSQIDPIKAYFPLGEQDYLRMAGRINARTSKQPWTGQAGLALLLADGSVYPEHGSFLAADREIDPKTGAS
jgi:membrane fusion protein (multidrug efflux system)